MKTLLAIIILAMTVGCASAQTDPAHEWKVTFKVVDDTDQPVAGAEVRVNYLSEQFVGLTDSNGVAIASHFDKSVQLAFQVQKPSHYPFAMQYLLGFHYDPEKWNPTVKIVLERVINPIPMYARKAQIQIPDVDKPIGFDLVEYDWIAPYGKGKQSDVVFETHRRWASRLDFDSTLNVKFLNSGDGLIVEPTHPTQSSGPSISQPAPLDGYLPEVSRELSNTPSGGWKDDAKNQNYYFRIRTVLDEKGMVKSALYGKIYGDFGLDPINSKTTWILFTYYLNPTPNSSNVEFDPSRNLFQNLPPMQQVKDP